MTVTVGISADAERKKSVRFPTVFWLGTVFRVDMNILYILWFFVIFSFFGWVFNVGRNLINEGRFYNKGFLTSPFCPTYGICGVLCCIVLTVLPQDNFIIFICSSILLSLLSVIIGMITEKLIGCKPWDYSDQLSSLGSYITIPYALLLGVLGLFLNAVMIPLLKMLIDLIPFTISLIVVLSLCFIILVDYVLSIVTAIRLKHRIKSLSGVLDMLDGEVSPEKIRELEENYNKLFTENILRRRLASAFPELKRSAYVKQVADKLDEIKQDNMKEYTQVFENKDEKPFAFGLCFTKLFWLFLIGSFIGTLMETVWALIFEGHFEMRVGMVYGPFIPVYGGGACFLTVALYKLYKMSDTLIFVISAVVGASFEYFCSWFQETMFGTVSWDYSDTPFNLNGRTNLMFALIWGFLGLVWVRYLYPFAAKLIEKIPRKTGSIITLALVVFMILDTFMTISAVIRWQSRIDNNPPAHALDVYLDKHFGDEKMEFLFPHMTNIDDKEKTSETATADTVN